MLRLHRIINVRFLTLVVFLVTACGGTKAGANETWSLVELLSKGERTDIVTETIEVRNCGVAERKTVSCSAGTSNDLTASLGGGLIFGEGIQGAIDAGVSASLGLGRDSGESLALDLPPEGFIYRYTVNKEFRVLAGEVLARSSAGKEREATYAFHASCSLRIESREELPCATTQASAVTPTAKPIPPPDTPRPILPTPTPETPTDTPLPPTPTYTPAPPTPTRLLNTPPGTVLTMGETWYADGIELRLTEAIFDPDGLNIGRSCYIVRFEMMNRSASPIYFAMDRNQFWITDNVGQRYEMQGKFSSKPFCTFTGYSPPIEISIESGQRFDYNWLDGGWNMQFFVPVTDPNIKSLTVHVANLPRIANAEWQIRIR